MAANFNAWQWRPLRLLRSTWRTVGAWLKGIWPRTLGEVAHYSQIVLAVVAIYGYVFTVRPIYQKERLAEDVADLTGDVSGLAAEKALLTFENGQLTADIGRLQQEEKTLIGEKVSLQSEIVQLGVTLEELELRLRTRSYEQMRRDVLLAFKRNALETCDQELQKDVQQDVDAIRPVLMHCIEAAARRTVNVKNLNAKDAALFRSWVKAIPESSARTYIRTKKLVALLVASEAKRDPEFLEIVATLIEASRLQRFLDVAVAQMIDGREPSQDPGMAFFVALLMFSTGARYSDEVSESPPTVTPVPPAP